MRSSSFPTASWPVPSSLISALPKGRAPTASFVQAVSTSSRFIAIWRSSKRSATSSVSSPKPALGRDRAPPVKAQRQYQETGEKQRLFTAFSYQAESWDQPRRIIAKVEYTRLGANQRFVVTYLVRNPQFVYDDIYVLRGDVENRIKELKLELKAPPGRKRNGPRVNQGPE